MNPKRAASGQKVFDAHVHVAPWDQLRPEVLATFRRAQPEFERIRRLAKDPGKFVHLLNAERVERACLINYVAPEVMGFTPKVNEWVHEYVRHSPDRFVAFGGFHPKLSKEPKREIERLLSTYELGGIKLHPPHQLFAANDFKLGGGALEILYSACEEARVPVLVHTGTSIFPGALNKFADPMTLDEVAVAYPKLSLILAHGGRPLYMETAQFLVRRHPNMWMDISSIPPKSLLRYFPRLEELSERVLFGSDWPGPHVPGMRQNADAFLKLPLATDAKRRIIHDNAAKLFK